MVAAVDMVAVAAPTQAADTGEAGAAMGGVDMDGADTAIFGTAMDAAGGASDSLTRSSILILGAATPMAIHTRMPPRRPIRSSLLRLRRTGTTVRTRGRTTPTCSSARLVGRPSHQPVDRPLSGAGALAGASRDATEAY